jgi:beta-lactamase class A
MLGGPPKVNSYVHNLGVQGIQIAASEMEMHTAWEVQYTNWCEPLAMLQLLKILYEGKSLSIASNTFLLKMLRAASTGPGRIKGLLPSGTEVAHKTGTGPVNEQGMTAATNDAGIITLSNGNHLAVVVFINDAFANDPTLEATIAKISKAAYDDALHW